MHILPPTDWPSSAAAGPVCGPAVSARSAVWLGSARLCPGSARPGSARPGPALPGCHMAAAAAPGGFRAALRFRFGPAELGWGGAGRAAPFLPPLPDRVLGRAPLRHRGGSGRRVLPAPRWPAEYY